MKSIYKSESGRRIVLEKYQEILNAWPVENRQYTVDTLHGRTFVIESGSRENPPLILIHGSVSNSFCWFGDVKRLSEAYNVYAIDMIGEAGYSDENRPKYQSGAYPEWLDNVTEALGLSRVSLVGISLGGWMALSYAVNYPNKVDNLMLVCPGGLYPERKSFMWKVIGFSLLGKWGKKQIINLVSGGKTDENPNDGLKKALEYTSLISKNFNPRMDKLPVFPGNVLEKLTMPTLVLFGDKDQILNAEESLRRIKKYSSNTHIKLLTDTGHVIANSVDHVMAFLSDK